MEVWACCPHASPLHGVARCLWDHHISPAALPSALMPAELPLPLSDGEPWGLLTLGFLGAIPGWMHSPFDVSFPRTKEEGEGFAIRGLSGGRAPSPTGSLQALEPASFWPDPPLRVRPAEDGLILLASGICFRSPVINPMTFCCAISLCLSGD